jgi:hypothetical protein
VTRKTKARATVAAPAIVVAPGVLVNREDWEYLIRTEGLGARFEVTGDERFRASVRLPDPAKGSAVIVAMDSSPCCGPFVRLLRGLGYPERSDGQGSPPFRTDEGRWGRPTHG